MADPHIAPDRVAGTLPVTAAQSEWSSRKEGVPSLRARSWSVMVTIAARVQASRLDRALARGDDPTSDRVLHRRAQQLTTRRARERLANALEAHLAEARRPARRGHGPAVPLCRVEVLRAAPELRRLALCLRGNGEVPAQAIAHVRGLLTDGHGPLYQHSPPGTLARVFRSATAEFCDEP